MKRSSSPSSPPSAPRLRLTPTPSRGARAVRLLLFSLALLATLAIPVDPLPRTALWLLLLAAAWRLRHERRWSELRVGDDAWWLRDDEGRWRRAALLGDTVSHRWLVVLRMRFEEGGTVSLVLPGDSLPPADHSALRRLLGGEVSRLGR